MKINVDSPYIGLMTDLGLRASSYGPHYSKSSIFQLHWFLAKAFAAFECHSASVSVSTCEACCTESVICVICGSLSLLRKTLGTFRENSWHFSWKLLAVSVETLNTFELNAGGKSSERYWKPRIYVGGYASVRIGKYVHTCRPYVHYIYKKIF